MQDSQDNKQVRMKYMQSIREYKRKSGWGEIFRTRHMQHQRSQTCNT